jgi:hypothetical protein
MKHYKDSQNNIYAYELDGSQDHLIPSDFIQIDDNGIKCIRDAEEQSRLSKLTYAEKRMDEYPVISEQLDILYHNGFDAWKSEIKKIKDKYPKS